MNAEVQCMIWNCEPPLIDDAGRRAKARAGSGRNRDHQALFHAIAIVERGKAGALVTEPEVFARTIRQAPGIDQLFIALFYLCS